MSRALVTLARLATRRTPLHRHPYPRFLCAKPPAPLSSLQSTDTRDLLLSPPALVVTREYEWGNIILGFEQANKYTLRAAPSGQVVGYLAEEDSIGRSLTRNVMRTRRPFKATVFDKDRNIVFVLRRPMFLVSTTVFVETPDGERFGELHMRWHLWRRRYSLYVEKTQFAEVDAPFLSVDFDMRDEDGKKMASVNKDFTGFAREIFTDARQYVLRMDPSIGLESDGDLIRHNTTVDLQQELYSEFKVGHKERAVILAAAIAIDFDYFSVHSRSGIGPGYMMMGGGGGGGGAGGPAGAGVPAGAGGAGGAGTAVGADILSDAAAGTAGTEGMGPEGDGWANEGWEGSGGDQGWSESGTEQGGDESPWATFEEADHGFQQDPGMDEDTWGGAGDIDLGGGDEETSRGVIGMIMELFSIFNDD